MSLGILVHGRFPCAAKVEDQTVVRLPSFCAGFAALKLRMPVVGRRTPSPRGEG